MIMESLSIERIRQTLTAETVGRQIYLLGEVPSTNSVLHRLAEAGAPEGTVLLAEGQTAGRGRQGKTWFSPGGMSLCVSVLFRPRLTLKEVPVFSFIASLALADAIREEGVEPAIKWPNDILVGKRKVAGILAESAGTDVGVEFVIVGAGANLNVEREAFRSALGAAAQSAVSLHEVAGREIDRNTFAGRFLTLLEEWFQIYLFKGASVVLHAWRDRDITTGRRVEVREGPQVYDGRALGVNAEGYLIVRDAHGQVHRVVSGEIRFLD